MQFSDAIECETDRDRLFHEASSHQVPQGFCRDLISLCLGLYYRVFACSTAVCPYRQH